jgi:predicted nucleic acid-binding protein
VTLTDTGPIVALLDDDDDHHAVCLGVAKTLPAGPLQTTWPCYTEAMYLLGDSGGYRFQERLWHLRATGHLQIIELTATETDRMAVLMAQYRNVPMDLADASLVVAAESRGIRRLFTTDGDFYIYRLMDGSVLEVAR